MLILFKNFWRWPIIRIFKVNYENLHYSGAYLEYTNVTFRQFTPFFSYLICSIFQIRFGGETFFFWFLFVKKNQIPTSVFKSSSSSTRSCQSNINAWCIFLSHTFFLFFSNCAGVINENSLSTQGSCKILIKTLN